MFLPNKQVKGKGIRTTIGNQFPEKIEETKLTELVQKLRDGDDSVKHIIVEGHIRLAIYIASKYASRTNTPDELVNEACYAVVTSVEVARERLVDNNITPWISFRINRHCHKYIADEKRRLASYMTIKRHNDAGNPVPNVAIQNESDTVSIDTFTRKTQSLSGKWTTTVRDIKDEVDFAIESETHTARRSLKRNVVRLRVLGYNDQEIASMLHKSPSLISKLRTEIREIFNEIEEK